MKAAMTNPTSYSINYPLLKLQKPVEVGYQPRSEETENGLGHSSKMLACEQCEYKTENRRHLNRHIDCVHKKLRNFACEQCDHRTSQKDLLNRHVKAVHDKIKDWSCGQCAFRTARRSGLKDHIKSVHEKTRDFGCDKCSYRAVQKKHLKAHIMAVHSQKTNGKVSKERGWVCGQCDHTAASENDLQMHLKEGHNKTEDSNETSEGAVCVVNNLKTLYEEVQTTIISHEIVGNKHRAPGGSMFNIPIQEKLNNVGIMQQSSSVMMSHVPRPQVAAPMTTLPPLPPFTFRLPPAVSLTRQPFSSALPTNPNLFGNLMPLPAPAPAGNDYWPATVSLVPKMPASSKFVPGNVQLVPGYIPTVPENGQALPIYPGQVVPTTPLSEEKQIKLLNLGERNNEGHTGNAQENVPSGHAAKGEAKGSKSTASASSATSSPPMTTQANMPIPSLPSQPLSNEVERLSSGETSAASSEVLSNSLGEDEPLRPVARKLTARMGFPTRREEPRRPIYYRLPKCEECDLHFAKETMQRHMALVHGRVNFEKEGTSVELKKPTEKNIYDQVEDITAESQPVNAHINLVHEEMKNENGTKHDNTSHCQDKLKEDVKVEHDRMDNLLCPQCNYKAGRKDHLRRHIQVVHEKIKKMMSMNKNISCGQCDYKANRKDNLQRHIQVVHEKIKKRMSINKHISCGQCDYKGRQDNVQRHVNVVHNKMKFKCGQCDFENARQDKLRRHVNAVHETAQDKASKAGNP